MIWIIEIKIYIDDQNRKMMYTIKTPDANWQRVTATGLGIGAHTQRVTKRSRVEMMKKFLGSKSAWSPLRTEFRS